MLVETSNAYARGMLAGVEEFISARGPWTVYLGEHGRGDRPPAWLERWDGDGILARVENENIARALESMRLPVVNLSFAPLIALYLAAVLLEPVKVRVFRVAALRSDTDVSLRLQARTPSASPASSSTPPAGGRAIPHRFLSRSR